MRILTHHHVSHVMCHVSYVMRHVSCDTCHMLRDMSHIFFLLFLIILFFLDKMVKLGEGLLSTGPTQSSLSKK